MTLKWIFGRGELHSLVSGQGLVVGTYKYGNAPSGSIKNAEFLHRLSKY
jgi:hypothetical protein